MTFKVLPINLEVNSLWSYGKYKKKKKTKYAYILKINPNVSGTLASILQ